jgi:glyceraldehyde 3-phosphate dehydrogenase|tara:strand:+ start:4662 stop:5624 length:963 start_codon:yes stop_codon:yes gene_type:complete
MIVKIGINGFGRIGRCVARYILDERPDIQLAKINASGDLESNSHLLHYDSIHGRWKGQLSDKLKWTHTRDINQLDWTGCDVVLECTGAFNDGNIAKTHILNGAKKVLISAPAKNVDRTVVYGVNHEEITNSDKIISNASCTTNCLAPMAKVLHQEFGIKRGIMTTVHSYTGDQSTVDRRHKDPYRARTAGMSMIPTSTGATKAIGDIIPELAGRLSGSAIRVPTANVSCVDFTFESEVDTSTEEINSALYNASTNGMTGVLGYETAPLVSIDYNHTSESCIVAADQTKVVDNRMVRVLAWYDNEWAFSCRMVDTAKFLGT